MVGTNGFCYHPELTVSLNSYSVSSERLDFRDGCVGTLLGPLTDIVDDNLLACLPKLKGDGLSQTTRRASDQTHLRVISNHRNGRRSTSSERQRCCRSKGGGGGESKESGKEFHYQKYLNIVSDQLQL